MKPPMGNQRNSGIGNVAIRNAAAIRNAVPCGLAAVLFASVLAGCGAGATTKAQTSTRAAGLGFDTAIVVGSIGEELDVMNATVCGGDGFYRKIHVEVVEQNGKHYDVIDTQCTASGETRRFYFDVSSCFPCPD